MDYQLIAVDLDDSLLGTDLEISAENKKALLKAIDQGVLVTIATGRMFVSALPYAKQLGLDVPLITYQGGLIKNALSNRIIYNRPLSLKSADKIIKMSLERKTHLQVYIDDKYYFERANDYSREYGRNIGVEGSEVGPLEIFLNAEPNKAMIIDEPDRIAKMREEFEAALGEEIEISISKPQFLEFTHKRANKGEALEHLAKLNNIPRDRVIAIGDSYNDISMIQYAGLGVAMGNAPDDVKYCADYITGNHDDNGVAQAISKFVLNGR